MRAPSEALLVAGGSSKGSIRVIECPALDCPSSPGLWDAPRGQGSAGDLQRSGRRRKRMPIAIPLRPAGIANDAITIAHAVRNSPVPIPRVRYPNIVAAIAANPNPTRAEQATRERRTDGQTELRPMEDGSDR